MVELLDELVVELDSELVELEVLEVELVKLVVELDELLCEVLDEGGGGLGGFALHAPAELFDFTKELN